MPMDTEFTTALDDSGSQGTLRAALQGRHPYALAATEDPTDFVATDTDTGAVVPAIIWNGAIFYYDPDDATSAHDGIAVLVSNDSKRYKITALVSEVSVLAAQAAPPVSPALGDAYRVTVGTGAWAGHDDDTAVWTARGWEFILPRVGMIQFVEDTDAFWHYTDAGAWVSGFGDTTLGANTIIPSNILGGRVAWVVENQTTNAPPGSPTDGVQYIIGSVPTGAWAGNAAKLAIAKGGTFTIYTPQIGWRAFDRALGVDVVYNGSGWVTAAGAYVSFLEDTIVASTAFALGTNPAVGGTPAGYVYSDTVPPATGVSDVVDPYQPVIAAKGAGNIFELEYWGRLTVAVNASSTGGADVTNLVTAIGIFVDSETNARDWITLTEEALTVTRPNSSGGTTTSAGFTLPLKKFLFTLADTANHTIRVRFMCRLSRSGSGTTANLVAGSVTMLRRKLIIREAA